jgi:hypothetical protein
LCAQKGRDAVKTRRKKGRRIAAQNYRHPLLQSLSPYLSCLLEVDDPSVRKVRWAPQAAAMAAVLMALGDTSTLKVRCDEALLCLVQETGGGRLGKTYNGLVKALLRQSETALPVMKAGLRRHVKKALARIEKSSGWTVLAVDGSKMDLPRTVSHEKAFGIADNGKCPQAFVTAIVCVRTQLLWDWRVDKGDASEKHHLVEMAAALPENCLLLADGNFVGYRVWEALAQRGRNFLIRVGGNVRLLEKLWPDAKIEQKGNIVYAWPKSMQGKSPPLILRLIKIGRGKDCVHLLTNVLNKGRMSDKTAGKIYRLRWGVEVFYRSFKRTLGFVKLKSRTGARGRVELEWALVAIAIMILLGLEALARRKVETRRVSPAGLLEVLRKSLSHGEPGRDAGPKLRSALALCVQDDYRRHGSKQSRHRPKTKNTPKIHRLKPPKIRVATAGERRIAREKHYKMAA